MNFINPLYIRYGIIHIYPELQMLDNEWKEKIKKATPNGIMLKNSLDISKCGIDYSKILDVSKPFVEKYYELDIDTLQVTRVVLINYSEFGDKKLNIHMDDSLITINYCLETTAEGNEVVFQGKKNMPNRKYKGFHSPLLEIAPENNNIYIHYGNHPHYTKNLLSGYRYSIIIWLDKSN